MAEAQEVKWGSNFFGQRWNYLLHINGAFQKDSLQCQRIVIHSGQREEGKGEIPHQASPCTPKSGRVWPQNRPLRPSEQDDQEWSSEVCSTWQSKIWAFFLLGWGSRDS